uniref:Ribosome biogenesis protein NOP53 n=1 Tax=Ciona savignyi TaxID=51511 RepID=H2YXW9_CIOSA
KAKRWNKNKKKNWRKKIDITDIEQGLEKKRLELRTGGLVKDKSDHELYFVEKKPVKRDDSTVHGRTKYKYRRLKVDQLLVPQPEDVKPANNRNAAKIRRRSARQDLIAKLHRKKAKLPGVCKRVECSLDIWNQDSKEIVGNVFQKNEIMEHTENVTGAAQVKRPTHLNKKLGLANEVNAVEPAHPGASYNPSLEHHQDLLLQEHNRESAKISVAEKIERAVATDMTQIATEESKEKELMEGLFDEGEGGMDEDKEEVVLANPPVNTDDRKTMQVRKREAREKEELKKKKSEWANKLKEHEIFRAKTFLSEIKEKEKNIELKKERRKLKKKMPVLSGIKYVEPDQDVQLSSELKGSLRQLKPEGNLIFDRYKSLQKRCIIEAREKFKPPRRKYKVKFQEKRSFREIEL